jgi:hypothetical protein
MGDQERGAAEEAATADDLALSARVLSTSLYVPIFQIVAGSLKRAGEVLRPAMIVRLFLNGSDGLALAATLKIIARRRDGLYGERAVLLRGRTWEAIPRPQERSR